MRGTPETHVLLGHAVDQLDWIPPHEFIFVRAGGDVHSHTECVFVPESEAASLHGFDGLLDVETAREVIQVWSEWRQMRRPSRTQKIAAIAHYAAHDAYLDVTPDERGPYRSVDEPSAAWPARTVDDVVASAQSAIDAGYDVARPRASRAEIEATGGAIGMSLPGVLRRLYEEVGNGGFGPGLGLVSTVDLLPRSLANHAGAGLVLPLFDWCNGAWTALAGAKLDRVVMINGEEIVETRFALAELIAQWLLGVPLHDRLFEMVEVQREGINPFTRQRQVFRTRRRVIRRGT